ncbi:MAG: hypothetical protein KME57_22140 [Scytonema hyalinum WJT4-NPBG1]|nr:hypothetical protein [Scytonema hyalinum WJT4-NPBG1]
MLTRIGGNYRKLTELTLLYKFSLGESVYPQADLFYYLEEYQLTKNFGKNAQSHHRYSVSRMDEVHPEQRELRTGELNSQLGNSAF